MDVRDGNTFQAIYGKKLHNRRPALSSGILMPLVMLCNESIVVEMKVKLQDSHPLPANPVTCFKFQIRCYQTEMVKRLKKHRIWRPDWSKVCVTYAQPPQILQKKNIKLEKHYRWLIGLDQRDLNDINCIWEDSLMGLSLERSGQEHFCFICAKALMYELNIWMSWLTFLNKVSKLSGRNAACNYSETNMLCCNWYKTAQHTICRKEVITIYTRVIW